MVNFRFIHPTHPEWAHYANLELSRKRQPPMFPPTVRRVSHENQARVSLGDSYFSGLPPPTSVFAPTTVPSTAYGSTAHGNVTNPTTAVPAAPPALPPPLFRTGTSDVQALLSNPNLMAALKKAENALAAHETPLVSPKAPSTTFGLLPQVPSVTPQATKDPRLPNNSTPINPLRNPSSAGSQINATDTRLTRQIPSPITPTVPLSASSTMPRVGPTLDPRKRASSQSQTNAPGVPPPDRMDVDAVPPKASHTMAKDEVPIPLEMSRPHIFPSSKINPNMKPLADAPPAPAVPKVKADESKDSPVAEWKLAIKYVYFCKLCRVRSVDSYVFRELGTVAVDRQRRDHLKRRRDELQAWTTTSLGRRDPRINIASECETLDAEISELEAKEDALLTTWMETRTTYWPFEPPEGVVLTSEKQEEEEARRRLFEVPMEEIRQMKAELSRAQRKISMLAATVDDHIPTKLTQPGAVQGSLDSAPTTEEVRSLVREMAALRKEVRHLQCQTEDLKEEVFSELERKTSKSGSEALGSISPSISNGEQIPDAEMVDGDVTIPDGQRTPRATSSNSFGSADLGTTAKVSGHTFYEMLSDSIHPVSSDTATYNGSWTAGDQSAPPGRCITRAQSRRV